MVCATPSLAQDWDEEEGSGDEVTEPWTFDANSNTASTKLTSYGIGEMISTLSIHCYFTNGTGQSHMDVVITSDMSRIARQDRIRFPGAASRTLARQIFVEFEGRPVPRMRPVEASFEAAGATEVFTLNFGAADSASAIAFRRTVSQAEGVIVFWGEDFAIGGFTGAGSGRAISRLNC